MLRPRSCRTDVLGQWKYLIYMKTNLGIYLECTPKASISPACFSLYSSVFSPILSLSPLSYFSFIPLSTAFCAWPLLLSFHCTLKDFTYFQHLIVLITLSCQEFFPSLQLCLNTRWDSVAEGIYISRCQCRQDLLRWLSPDVEA